MPKKFKGENSKSVDSRARKSNAKTEEREKKEKALEDTLWVDDDKEVAKKTQRKEEKVQKKHEQAEKKKELAALYDAEMESIEKTGSAAASSSKVTRHQLEQHRKQVEAEEAAQRKQDSRLVKASEDPIEENFNKIQIEGEARSIDAAINLLSKDAAGVEKNPEKRMKAAYQAFEDKQLPILKSQHTNLRLSQIKQLLKKEWQKSPENPFNSHILK